MRTIVSLGKKWVYMLALLSFWLFSCSKDSNGGTSTIRARLTDAPGNFEEVNIDVIEVKANVDDQWQPVTMVHAGIYNLLDFNNGMSALIADGSVPSGHVSQMRLILGPDNSVKVDGNVYAMTTPSSEESGLKFNIDQDLANGITYDIWIDFDAGRSVVLTGSGTYALKPVIRAYTAANSGAIAGTVIPVAADPYIMAVMGTDTISTYAESTGYFLLSGAAPGTYTVTVSAMGYQTITLYDIHVSVGEVTQMGTITMTP